MFSRTKTKEVWGRYRRAVRLGPVETSLTPAFQFQGIDFEVDEEYVAVINAADAEVFDSAALPQDPLPDL